MLIIFNKPNFLGARIPVRGQLNIFEWKRILVDYWDQQLLQLIEFGFLLDFNRNSNLSSEGNNHSSARDHPDDIMVYLTEEKQHQSLVLFQTIPYPMLISLHS